MKGIFEIVTSFVGFRVSQTHVLYESDLKITILLKTQYNDSHALR